MGLLDSAANMLGGNQQQAFNPHARLLQSVLSLIADNGQNGGLHGLVERFQEVGLGNVISSWIGTGENVPITPEQVHQALGEGHLQQISEETGLSEPEAANQLSEMLPQLVDTVTPAGHIPQGGVGSVSNLLERVIGHLH
jgi:uncharacterized protein YidB (DUF937 family)